MTEREKLVKELGNFCIHSNDSGDIYDIEKIADFILEDRKKVVEPLVKYKTGKNTKASEDLLNLIDGITETLKNAGWMNGI